MSSERRYTIIVDRSTKHDLMGALNVIIGYTEMLLEQSDEPEQKVATSDLTAILSAAKEAVNLLQKLFEEQQSE